jgi:hypothetical protein
LMETKAEAQKGHLTMPTRPVYNGTAPLSTCSYQDELKAPYRKKDEALERLKGAIRYRAGVNRIQQRREELREAEQAILAVEDARKRNQEEYRQRLREYQHARELHRRSVSTWEQAAAKVERRRKAHERRMEIVHRAQRRVAEAFKPKHAPDKRGLITRDFEIARPDEQGDEHLRAYYREVIGRGRLEGEFSQYRFEKMLALPRSGWQKGKAGFCGYIALMFDHTEKVVLECPVEGNAIYLLYTGEDRLLAKNKRQLRESGEAKRIFHTGDNWYRRLKDKLGIA